VLSTLARLAERPTPLVRNRGRRPGQSQDRWTQTLGSDETAMQPRVRAASDRRADAEERAEDGMGGEGFSGAEGSGGAEPVRRSDHVASTTPTTAPDADPAPLLQQLLDRVEALERRVAALEADAG